jgi:hypothetical protein
MTEKYRDYWEENGQVFVTIGKRYGLTAGCRTVCIGPENTPKTSQDVSQLVANGLPIHPDTPLGKQLTLKMEQGLARESDTHSLLRIVGPSVSAFPAVRNKTKVLQRGIKIV